MPYSHASIIMEPHAAYQVALHESYSNSLSHNYLVSHRLNTVNLWYNRAPVRVRPCVYVRVCACVCAYGGERAREVGLLPSRVLPKFDFDYSPSELSGTTSSGCSCRIAALSALHEARLASCSTRAFAISPLVRKAPRSTRVQSLRSAVGNPTYTVRSTISGPFEGVAQPASKLAATSGTAKRRRHPSGNRGVSPATVRVQSFR